MAPEHRFRLGPRGSERKRAGTRLAVSISLVAASAASLVLAASAFATPYVTPEKTTLSVVTLKTPARLTLDHPATISLTVKNRGSKTVPAVAVRLSVGLLPDPGFKISWATARTAALTAGASRSFTFHVTISSRYDKEHTDKVTGQTLSFYGAGTYVIEACTGPTLTADDACRDSPALTVR